MSPQPTLFPLPPPTGHRQSKRKSPALQRIKVDHELAKPRYYCHRRLKGVFPIDPEKRTVYVAPYTSLPEIPKKYQKYIAELIELGYNIQLSINER